jgi:hypothetical protein
VGAWVRLGYDTHNRTLSYHVVRLMTFYSMPHGFREAEASRRYGGDKKGTARIGDTRIPSPNTAAKLLTATLSAIL